MIRLGVNIDHVATIRQARRGKEPEPITAAMMAMLAGADGITVHLREDRRHIQDRDVFVLRQMLPQGLNLEMATAEEIVEIALQVRPDEATLVPERRAELTTEGGLDVVSHHEIVANAITRLKDAEIKVSLFIDPDFTQIEASKRLGADAIEFQTATYSEAIGSSAIARQISILRRATDKARELGLHVHMGHGLNYTNVQAIAAIPGVEELNIGHSIVSRAVLVGFDQAVRDMKAAIAEGVARRN